MLQDGFLYMRYSIWYQSLSDTHCAASFFSAEQSFVSGWEMTQEVYKEVAEKLLVFCTY